VLGQSGHSTMQTSFVRHSPFASGVHPGAPCPHQNAKL
jgi:hypothetical protein